MKKFAVIGNPINHSKSPQIHQAFAEQFGLEIDYQKIEVGVDEYGQAFTNFIAEFEHNSAIGCNVTLPFKQNAFAVADKTTSRAEFAEAANTLHFTNKGILAENTDGIGLVNDIQKNLNQNMYKKNILVIGAGGAVRGVLASILDENPSSLTIINRTASKANELADICRQKYSNTEIFSSGLDLQKSTINYDVIINGSSSSVGDDVPNISPELFDGCLLAYDMMYKDNYTSFETFALANGAQKTQDGLGMLVEQAAASFSLWHGKKPKTEAVRKALRGDKYNDETSAI